MAHVRLHRHAPSDGPAVLVGIKRGDGHDAGGAVGAGDGSPSRGCAIGKVVLLLHLLLLLKVVVLLLLLVVVLLLRRRRGSVGTALSGSRGLVIGLGSGAAVVDSDLRRRARRRERVGVDRLADGRGVPDHLEGEDDDEP